MALGGTRFVGVNLGKMVLTLGGAVVAVDLEEKLPEPSVGPGINRSATNPTI